MQGDDVEGGASAGGYIRQLRPHSRAIGFDPPPKRIEMEVVRPLRSVVTEKTPPPADFVLGAWREGREAAKGDKR